MTLKIPAASRGLTKTDVSNFQVKATRDSLLLLVETSIHPL